MRGKFLEIRGMQIARELVLEFANHAVGELDYDLERITKIYEQIGTFGVESIEPVAAEMMKTNPHEFFKLKRVIDSDRAYQAHIRGTPLDKIDYDGIASQVIDDYLDVLINGSVESN